MFGAVERLEFNASREAKALALAADYFKKGKSVEWVIQATCGTNKAIKRRVITMADTMRLIDRAKVRALKEQHGLLRKGE